MGLQVISTTISEANQTAVPSLIRKILELKAGDRLLWNIDSSRKMARIKLAPRNWGQYMNGLGEDIWKDTNAKDYLDSLRSDRSVKRNV